MKLNAIFFLASFMIIVSSFSQSYYINSLGEQVDAEIVEWSLTGIKIKNGSKKSTIKAEDMKCCIIESEAGRDSIAKLENTGMPFAPKHLLMQVISSGKITYYFESHWTSDDMRFTYILLKDGKYQDITVTNKKWKEFFSDDSDIYSRINNLKYKEYTDTEIMKEIIDEYNANNQ